MYGPLKLTAKYLSYYLSASNGKGHGTHSPFVFEFITKVLNDRKEYRAYTSVEKLREELLANTSAVYVEDLGAGSAVSNDRQRTIASVAKYAAKPRKYGQLLYRMVKHYHPQNILELGTSLGLTTSYLSLGNPGANVVTMEGVPAIAAIAQNNFQALALDNISVVEGNFDHTLSAVIDSLGPIDFCFVDGNHRREPTVRYFQQLLPKVHNNTILIFDDIHWSEEMEQAWDFIKKEKNVRCTIDLFFIGIVLFRHEFREKQHFVIRF